MGPHDGRAWREYSERKRGREIADLAEHWGEAYVIWYAVGQFWARRRDTGAVVKADSADELREQIREDYSARPVPRNVTSER
jgi:hypothetical protein